MTNEKTSLTDIPYELALFIDSRIYSSDLFDQKLRELDSVSNEKIVYIEDGDIVIDLSSTIRYFIEGCENIQCDLIEHASYNLEKWQKIES